MSAGESGEQAFQQLSPPLRQWLALERFHLHNAQFYQHPSRDPAFNTGYFPQNCGAFALPCCFVPRRSLHLFGGQSHDPDEMTLLSGEGGEARVLFPMHPTSVDQYQEFLVSVGARDAALDDVRIWAVPTSSTRTVLAWPDGAPDRAVLIKTSLHSPIFGNRRIQRMNAGRSVGLSALVQSESPELPEALRYFPESLAFTPRRPPQSGAIVRSIPSAIKQGTVRVAPLFSLLGGSGAHVPLLLTILERTGMPPQQFVHNVLCEPFAKLWLDLSMNFGWLIEAHAQDLLLELSPDLLPTGHFYYRDFEGLQVDWDLRRRRGRAAPHGMPNEWSWRTAYGSWGDYPYCDLTWYKWHVSLFDYLHFVLHETETSLRDWHKRGLIGGPPCGPDEATMMFSLHLFATIEKMFNVHVGRPYNVYSSLKRFLIFLAKVRREVMDAPLRPAGAALPGVPAMNEAWQ